MWIMTPRGFYSAVQKDPDFDTLTIRARARGDLESLCELPTMRSYAEDISEGAGTDYPYRIEVRRDDWNAALAAMGDEIDYSNFKDEVKEMQGKERAATYGRVWSALLDLEPEGWWDRFSEQIDWGDEGLEGGTL